MNPSHLVIGLMSGTSLDGVDAALVEITGSGEGTRFSSSTLSRSLLRMTFRLNCARSFPDACAGAGISHLNFLLATLYSEATTRLCLEAGIELNQVDLIGSHGQTIFTSPSRLSAGACWPRRCRSVKDRCWREYGHHNDFRFSSARHGRGRKGAPLIPYVDYLLFRIAAGPRSLNVGGIETSLRSRPRDDGAD
jgi:anhydro-N-acetylmuramic acid kinase